MVGETYAQLLSMSEPEPNVVVASPDEPFAAMAQTDLVNAIVLAENEEAAGSFGCAPPGQS